MNNIHDFWSGKTHIPPGLSPAYSRTAAAAAAGQCIPQRNRLTGAYQMPAAVWMEQQPAVARTVEQPVEQAQRPVTVGTLERFEWLEIRGQS